MAQYTIPKKYSIPVITHTGTSYLDFYYTTGSAFPSNVGTTYVSASLPTTAPTGSSLVGYKLKIANTVVAHFKEGPLYSQTAIGYNDPFEFATVTTTMQQYENKIVRSGVNIYTFYSGIRNAIIEGSPITFEAIYQTIKIKLNDVPTDGIEKVVFNENDCNAFQIDEGGGWGFLFSKTLVTLKYVSKVNFPASGGFPTCTIQTVTGMDHVLMPNYKINKYVLPTSVQYNSTIDSIFEREEPDAIKSWKDEVCMPVGHVRSTVMVIPQKSKYIKSINVFKLWFAPDGSTAVDNLGEIKKMIEFDEVDLSENLGHRKFETTGAYHYATYMRFNLVLKNTGPLSGFTDNHGLVWTFTVRDMNVSNGSVVVRIKDGSTIIASESFAIANNQTYSGIFTGIKGYASIDLEVQPVNNVGSTTKLAFCPFYIKN